MDQERHGNVKIVKNASITKMFAIMKLSVLMAATKWNAVSILDIVKSILQFYTMFDTFGIGTFCIFIFSNSVVWTTRAL